MQHAIDVRSENLLVGIQTGELAFPGHVHAPRSVGVFGGEAGNCCLHFFGEDITRSHGLNVGIH
jgi:hypothetical protein